VEDLTKYVNQKRHSSEQRITTSKIMNEQQLSPIQRLNNIKKRITDACNSFQIDTDFVQLIGVSKTKPANLIEMGSWCR